MTLGDYLERAGREPWRWGVWDCCIFPGGWVEEQCGRDPIARWRGRYRTEDEAEAFIAEAGGLLNLWRIGLDDIGCEAVDAPEIGDVGVLSAFGHEAGGIFTGRRWALLTPRGLAAASFAPGEVLGMWRAG